jgi:hypothetical protein
MNSQAICFVIAITSELARLTGKTFVCPEIAGVDEILIVPSPHPSMK